MKLKMLLTDIKEDANEKINMVICNRKSTFREGISSLQTDL